METIGDPPFSHKREPWEKSFLSVCLSYWIRLRRHVFVDSGIDDLKRLNQLNPIIFLCHLSSKISCCSSLSSWTNACLACQSSMIFSLSLFLNKTRLAERDWVIRLFRRQALPMENAWHRPPLQSTCNDDLLLLCFSSNASIRIEWQTRLVQQCFVGCCTKALIEILRTTRTKCSTLVPRSSSSIDVSSHCLWIATFQVWEIFTRAWHAEQRVNQMKIKQ